MENNIIKSTTIVGIRKDSKVVIAGDGQASFGNTVVKSTVKKVRRVGVDESLIAGFAGSTADSFALLERLESKLEQHTNQLKRACVELAKEKEWEKEIEKKREEFRQKIENEITKNSRTCCTSKFNNFCTNGIRLERCLGFKSSVSLQFFTCIGENSRFTYSSSIILTEDSKFTE